MAHTNEANAAQVGRGRDADAPSEIPFPGWKDVLWRLYRAFAEDRILLTAAGATFYILLAMVPTLTAFVSIYGIFNNRADVIKHVELLIGIVPPGVFEVIREQLTRLTAESNDTLGLTLLFSLAIALWSASAGVKAMFEAMNVAYHESERRNFLVLNGTALLRRSLGLNGHRRRPGHAASHCLIAWWQRSTVDSTRSRLRCHASRSLGRVGGTIPLGTQPRGCQVALDHARCAAVGCRTRRNVDPLFLVRCQLH